MEKIKKMIADGQTQKALSLLNEHLANHPEDDQAWFLKGNAYRKLGETRLALNSYLEAIAINPDSPAQPGPIGLQHDDPDPRLPGQQPV